MKKKLLLVLAATALYAVLANLKVEGIGASIAERSFSSKFGPNGYLLNAANRFRDYRFKKEYCRKKKCKRKCKRNKKKKRYENLS